MSSLINRKNVKNNSLHFNCSSGRNLTRIEMDLLDKVLDLYSDKYRVDTEYYQFEIQNNKEFSKKVCFSISEAKERDLNIYLNLPDDILLQGEDVVTYEFLVSLLGEFIDPKQVVLYINTIGNNKHKLVTTFVHEMYHAYFDTHENFNEYVEEPIVEYSTLRFVEELEKEDGRFQGITEYYKEELLRKQKVPGIAHYGFGAYLFDHQSVEWTETFKKYCLCLNFNSIEFKEYVSLMSGIYPFDEEAKCLDLLRKILFNDAESKPVDNKFENEGGFYALWKKIQELEMRIERLEKK